jgi:hypothetical protein
LGNHVVDQAMFVPDAKFLEFGLVCPTKQILVSSYSHNNKSNLLFIDFLEDILESTIISLKDCVFGRHVQRVLLANGHLENQS